MTKKFYAQALIDALTETAEEDPGFALIGRGILAMALTPISISR